MENKIKISLSHHIHVLHSRWVNGALVIAAPVTGMVYWGLIAAYAYITRLEILLAIPQGTVLAGYLQMRNTINIFSSNILHNYLRLAVGPHYNITTSSL